MDDMTTRPRGKDERDAFTCPKCGGQVVMERELPRRVTDLGSINFRCLGCGDWIDVVLDREHVYKPVYEFEQYAVVVAMEYLESRAREASE